MKEIVVISGKGGTGKTSISAAFAALADNPAVADCDVDAADLHLLLRPEVRAAHAFSGGKQARVEPERCTGCGVCAEVCRFGAIGLVENGRYAVDPAACEGCGVCAWFCAPLAMRFEDAPTGEWFVSDTRFGPLVHARLGVAAENSGKLVTLVRERARELAEERGCAWLIVDGPPGIGCPVIASIAGADLVLIVTEPTVSGEHDLDRVAELAAHFGVRAAVCVNKADLNPEAAARIRRRAEERGLAFAGEVPYDRKVTAAQVEGRAVVERDDGALAGAVRALWERVAKLAEERRES